MSKKNALVQKKLLPIGTTNHYIEQLKKDTLTSEVLKELRDNYDNLTFNYETRLQFIDALLVAIGKLKLEGFLFWKTEKITQLSSEALKTLLDFLLIDKPLLVALETLYHQKKDVMLRLKFDAYLEIDTEEARGVAIELINFLIQYPLFANYLEYVKSDLGKKLVTQYLQDKENKNKKRKKPEMNEIGNKDEDSNPSEKKIKLDKWSWFWANDSDSGHQNDWIKYEPDIIEKLEVALDKKQKTVKIDTERFVDLQNMVQKRFDNVDKKRAVKREQVGE